MSNLLIYQPSSEPQQPPFLKLDGLPQSVLQIRDFQLVGQWAEGLKGILSPPGGPGKMHISTYKKHHEK